MKKIRYILVMFVMVMAQLVMAQGNGGAAISVGVMLPLHNINGDGRRMTEYYRGLLMGVERLKQDGRNVNVYAWNVAEDADIRTTLLSQGANTCNFIFGPLYSKQVKQLGDFCRAYGIKMVIPFSINSNEVDVNPMVYQVYQSPDDINVASIQHIAESFSGYHPVFIDCNDTTSNKWAFTSGLRQVLSMRNIRYNITNVKSPDDLFVKSFSISQPNIVILNSARSPELTQVLNKLDRMTDANLNVQVTLFGYTDWLMYAKHNKDRFAKYNVYVPTHFYYNESADMVKQFEQKYRWRFHQDMMYALPHFAMTGYDHAMHFIGNSPLWLQSPLKFVKQGDGGYRNKAYMLIHYKQDGGIEAITY